MSQSIFKVSSHQPESIVNALWGDIAARILDIDKAVLCGSVDQLLGNLVLRA